MSSAQGPFPGRFVWHDLMTTDAAKAVPFYTGLFDWQLQDVPMAGFTYRMIVCGPGPIGGIVEEKNVPLSHWMPYLAVADVDAAAQQVQDLGGSVCVPPTDIPQTGRFAVVGDPTGAWFSIYKGLPGSEGFDPDLPVPGRICWNETYSTDKDRAQRFYSALAGWEVEPIDMGPNGVYHVQKKDGKQAGGLMQHPLPNLPSCWVVYFLVENLQRSTAKAEQLGGKVMMADVPIPGVGKFSMVTDPAGAMFALFEASVPATGPC